MKKVLKVLAKTMKWIFIVFCFFLLSLFFRQQRLPDDLVERICEKCSTTNLIVSCDEISVGFRHGVHFRDLRFYNRNRSENLKPVFSADAASVWLLSRRVRVVAAKMPRLSDSYYGIVDRSPLDMVPGPPVENSVPEGDFVAELANFELPRVPSFTLELIRPEILGVAPERVVARVETELKKLALEGIHLDWPDQDMKMWLDGSCTLDFGALLLVGDMSGTARQEHIRPLLKALDLPVSYPYMGGYPDTGTSGFTEVPGPVPVTSTWKYDFAARDFTLHLDLHPNMGRYNNVRLNRVDGELGVHAYYTDDWFGYDIEVGPLVASDLRGRKLQGWLTVHGTNNLDHLEFDAESGLDKQDVLDIVGYFNDGILDDFKCEAPPRLTAKGVFNCDDVNIPNNDLSGVFEFEQGEIFDQRIAKMRLDYHLKGSDIEIENIVGKGESGGDITGRSRFHLPIADDDEAGLCGEGVLDTRGGRVAQVPLFLALTSALAENVPGIDKIVNQSESHCEFAISNGVFTAKRLVVQGALFCIKLTGTYDIRNDRLDFIAHCTILKEESVLGKYLIQPVLWPFTKLLTEFHVTGSKDEPKIRNMSVKRISEVTDGLLKKVFD